MTYHGAVPSARPAGGDGGADSDRGGQRLPAAQVEVRVEPFTSAAARVLLAEADSYTEPLYGTTDRSPIDPAQFDGDNGGAFLVAYVDEVPVGCVGVRGATAPGHEGAAEFKRMFVTDGVRAAAWEGCCWAPRRTRRVVGATPW